MSLGKCQCGKRTKSRIRFYEFRNLTGYKILEYYTCKECAVEEGTWCDEHGPCYLTNFESFMTEMQLMTRKEDDVVVFCPGCVQDTLRSIESKVAQEYLQMLSRRCERDYLRSYRELSNLFLPQKYFTSRPLLSACCLISHLNRTPVEMTVLKLSGREIGTEITLLAKQKFVESRADSLS